MFEIELCYSTRMILCFNKNFEIRFCGTISAAILKMKTGMITHLFDEAVAYDENTGEILISISRKG